MKALVVYYSRTGNTQFVAERIAKRLNADLEKLVDKKKRGGPIGWLIAGKDATFGKETEIEETLHSPDDYDLIVLGNPVWNKRVPPAMRTYLNRNDLSKKKIALFNTNNSDDEQNTFSMVAELAGGQEPVAQLVLSKIKKKRSGAAKKTEDWCGSLISSLTSL